MRRTFEHVPYESLNSMQKESYNFQKVSAVLADFGYVTIRLSDDWHGADFLAKHVHGDMLHVQLKGRLTFEVKYLGKDLWICFPEGDSWYLYPHDSMLKKVSAQTNIAKTKSWTVDKSYSFPQVPSQLRVLLEPYRLIPKSIREPRRRAKA